MTRNNQTWHHFFWSKNINVFQWLSKSNFLRLTAKVNPNNGNKTKSVIFSWYIFKSDIIFLWSQILKNFNAFYNFDSFNFIAKVSTNKKNKIKLDGTCVNLTSSFLIYKVLKYYGIQMTFYIYFLKKCISKLNNDNSKGKKIII